MNATPPPPLPPYLSTNPADPRGESCILQVKAVPGAKRDQIAGPLGDRLKIRVAAPPEDGRANKAICSLVATALSLRESAVTLIRGQTNPEKTFRISGISAVNAAARLEDT